MSPTHMLIAIEDLKKVPNSDQLIQTGVPVCLDEDYVIHQSSQNVPLITYLGGLPAVVAYKTGYLKLREDLLNIKR